MKENDITIHYGEDGEVKSVKVAEDASVESLLNTVEAEGILLGELEADILFLVGEEAKLLRKEHKLHEHGFQHGGHIHIAKSRHIFVEVVTTSGTWPPHGYASVPSHQPVKDQLHHAAKKLGLTDTSSWVAKVAGREIDINKNYPDNGLHRKVAIDYGPRAGGGGNE